MRSLDETDLAILNLLLEDARRPYNDIADRVDVSAPTVSDRIDRLSELGIIDGFTLDLDRSRFASGVELLIDVELDATCLDDVSETIVDIDGIEHVFTTTDARLVAIGALHTDRVGPALLDALEAEQIDSYRVHLLQNLAWDPSISDETISLNCHECATQLDGEYVAVRIEGDLHHFCDGTCHERYERRRSPVAKSS